MTKIKLYCNSCKNKTWHELAAEVKQNIENQLWGYPQLIEAQIYQCSGCDQLTFRRLIYPMEFEEDQKNVVEDLFPARSYTKRGKEHFFRIPKHIGQLYDETIIAYDSKLFLLATAGLRALIEAIVIDKFSDSEIGKSLFEKINILKKHFNDDVIKTLHEFRELGNQALHQQVQPERLELHNALNVVEDVMTFFYKVEESVLIYNSVKEANKKPKRKKK